ncbi:MAG: 2-C-methyl-D-erythritol 4-phosphate cytidylyltransferase [Candidatus Binataceae bacterium]
MKASAIVVAAGVGRRLGMEIPKAFVELGGHALLWYSLRTIAAVAGIDETVIAVPHGMERMARAEAVAAHLEIPVKITPGGAERQDSVRLALTLTSAESEMVVVHDAARPFATAELFIRCLERAAVAGGAIAAIPLADTLKRIRGNAADETWSERSATTIVATIPRAGLWQAQTPQAFRRDLLIAAHQRALRENIAATDDADLVEHIARVEVVESRVLNLKVTSHADLELARAFVSRTPD